MASADLSKSDGGLKPSDINNKPVMRRKHGVAKMTRNSSGKRDSGYQKLMKALSGVDDDLGIEDHSDFLSTLAGKSPNESLESIEYDSKDSFDGKDGGDGSTGSQNVQSPRRKRLERGTAVDKHDHDSAMKEAEEKVAEGGFVSHQLKDIKETKEEKEEGEEEAKERNEGTEEKEGEKQDKGPKSGIKMDEIAPDGKLDEDTKEGTDKTGDSATQGNIPDDIPRSSAAPEIVLPNESPNAAEDIDKIDKNSAAESEEGSDDDDFEAKAEAYKSMMSRMRGRQESLKISGRRGSLTIAGRRDSIVDPNFAAVCRRSSMTVFSFSESYFAVKGAALILPQSECPRTVTKGSHGGDIQHHLQSMFYLLRQQDTIKVAVKLESLVPSRVRYMAVVSTMGRQDTEESVILGIDIVNQQSTIGMVLPVWSGTRIQLDGDGGFSVTASERHHVFKPVSVQAMWSALQSLIKASEVAGSQRYFPRGLTHTWVTYYEGNIKSDQYSLNEWHEMPDLLSRREEPILNTKSNEELALEKTIKAKLKDLMMQVDLEEVTSKTLRTRLEQDLGMDLKLLRHFIDEEMIIILRQMDSASAIYDYLYLGSEWNASNLEELRENGIEYILNVTREIDNFFPGMFEYKNIRLYDVEQSDLLKHWEETYKFIKKAKMANSKVLVHCKMGISRSASTVIAFAMKEYDLSFEEAYDNCKRKRNCIKPNNGFLQQLITYQGILDASRQRHNSLWRSRSTGNLLESGDRRAEDREDITLETIAMNIPLDLASPSSRPRSWSPDDNTTRLLAKTKQLASDDDSSEAENQGMSDSLSNINTAEPLHPAFFHWEDLDALEMASVDGLEMASTSEVESDTPSQKKCDHNGDPNVVLLSHNKLDWDAAVEKESQAAEADAVTEESEIDDVIGQENAGRPEKGFYDVSMFYVNLAPSEEEGPIDEEEERDLNYYLHPDIKIELLFAQQRKHRRTAQLLKWSERELKESPPVPVVRPDSDQTNVPNPQPVFTKLREDSSWIKPVEMSPEPTGAIAAQVADTEVAEVDLQVLEGATVDESSTDVVVAEEASVAIETQSKSDSPEGAEGVDCTYKKEDIPWSAGTVKNFTKDFEERIKESDSKSKKRSRSASSCSTSSSSLGSGDEGAQENVGSKTSAKDVSVESSPLKNAQQQQGATQAVPATSGSSSANQEAPENPDEPSSTAIRPTSIYDAEEIPLEPGIVRRTKQEIESRKVIDVPPEPSVQFGIDAKEERSGSITDRKSSEVNPSDIQAQEEEVKKEVVKTVSSQPKVSTESPKVSSESPKVAETKPQVSESVAAARDAEEERQRRILHIGQETVEMPVGIVDKLHREYSERAKDEGDVKEAKDRSHSPLEEEGLEIPTGSVKRQLKQIEKVYNVPAPTATSEAAKPTANDLNQPVSSSNTVPTSATGSATGLATGSATGSASSTGSTSTANITLTSAGVTQPNTTYRSPPRLGSAQESAASTATTNATATVAPSVITSSTDPVAATPAASLKATSSKVAANISVAPTQTGGVKTKSLTAKKDSVTQPLSEAPKSESGAVASSGIDSTPSDTNMESQPVNSVYKEEAISWNVGTVKQHKAAIENKLSEKSVSASRRESQSCESASQSVKDSPSHGSNQSSTQTLEAASEKLTLSLKKLDPAKSPPHDEQPRRLFIIEKNPNSNTSPEKGRNVQSSSKSSPIGRSHSLKETKSKVVSRPRSHTDSSTSLEATLELSAKLSPLSSPSSPGRGGESSQDQSDSDCSEKSDGQSVKDLRGFFETKEITVDRSKRPSSLHGTESSQQSNQAHKKVGMTTSLDSVAASQNVQVREETSETPAGQESSPVRPASSSAAPNVQSSNIDSSVKSPVAADPVTGVLSPTSEAELKVRRQHGKSHPLTRLAQESGGPVRDLRNNKGGHGGRRSSNPVYNTM